MKAWRVWRELTWEQRRTLFLALVVLPCLALGLRRVPLASLRPEACARAPRADVLAQAKATARPVNLVADRFRATCLTRSLALQWILARRGIPSALRVGVRNDAGHLQAHAWLECEGVPVNDVAEGLRGFARLDIA